MDTLTPRFQCHHSERRQSQFNFYKKKAKKPLFVHHKSWLPMASKRNIILNERNRIAQRCSSEQSKEQHNTEFDEVLRLNGYPEQVINSTKSSNKRLPDRNRRKQTHRKLRTGYISASRISLTPSTTGSREFSNRRDSRCASLTDLTP